MPKVPMTDDERDGRRFAITTARHNGGFTATMRRDGCRSTWAEWRPTEPEAIGAALNYLHPAIRRYVRINPQPTEAQHEFLQIVHDFGGDGEGWAEIELQYECQRGGVSSLIPSIVHRVAAACERAGWITMAADGPTLTAAGLAAIGTRTP